MSDLLRKLGYKPCTPAASLHVPENVAPLLAGVEEGPQPRWILAFARDVAALAKVADEAVPLYQRGGHLWFAYPKKTGRIKTDISRDVGWEPVQDRDLLGVTQIAVDETWSAIRFRYRDEIDKLTRKASKGGKAQP